MAQREGGVAERSGDVEARRLFRAIGDRAAYGALRTLWSLLVLAGPDGARRVLEAVATLFSRLDRRHRSVVEENLAIAFPQMDGVVRDSVIDASFRNWGRVAAEAVHDDALIAEAREDPQWKALAAAVAEGLAGGRGLLVLTAHLGNFELLARIFGTLVAPIAVFHRPLGNAGLDAFLVRERARCGVRTLGRGAAVRDALRILAAGGCVAIPLDQNQREGHGIFVDVLGRPACTSTVLARLSMASGAPVLPVFAVWTSRGTSPIVHELLPAPARSAAEAGNRGGDRDALLRERTTVYCAEIDRVVRRFPHQWNWAHRRWKTRPPGSAGVDAEPGLTT